MAVIGTRADEETVGGYTWTYCLTGDTAALIGVYHNGGYGYGGWFDRAVSPEPEGDVIIPSSLGGKPVSCIGHWAFSNCSGLTSVTIPDSVTSIELYAFQDCTNLTSVTIPDSVTRIGTSAFNGCSGLTSVTIGNGVTSIGNCAFYNCSGLMSVTIPDGVMRIGDYAFNGCTNLTSVRIPDSVTSIGDGAFGRTSFYANQPDGLVVVGKFAHMMKGTCPASVTIPDSVTSIGDGAFHYTSLTSVTIPDSVTSIGAGAFEGCGLTSVTIPDSVTSIGARAFGDCRELTSVTIGDNVMSIGDYAFEDCISLTSVTIPDSVTSIGYGAFYDCEKLVIVTIGSGVSHIPSDAFGDDVLCPISYMRAPMRLKDYVDKLISVMRDGDSGLLPSGGVYLYDVVYTVNLDANGGMVGVSSLTWKNPEGVPVVGTLPTAVRSGYSFDGWYTAASGGELVTGLTKVIDGATYYAHWTASGEGGTATNDLSYALTDHAADRAIATVTVSGDTAIDSFVLKDGKVYDSVLRIVNTSGSAVRLTLPFGYTYETFRGAAPLTIPANSRNILTITRTADNVFLVTREELETVQ